ncbi:cysteinyl-tRNA synthetase [Orenia metallireducens]|uniref:Cysteine--tRNA ligase n=1 Tax=Orenia metallireducens TaxID=1413210 RepID=A0A285H8E8_9FIRM|nr:cysteine--tRNA ligase [Orenia metallireducens]PRX26184.1 cysteinyl-tRNA synthetase [Orenia metallireducens]SNY32032.1 cysteinyl-tRNA synthetase [Orenia metallireducens]
MTLKVYNSLSGEKEIFKTLEDKKVKIYSCGPTVYDYFHIGNARAFMVPDIIKRYLTYKGYDVLHVMNFTDIDDKMINRANEEGISVQELANRFITAFFEDIERLNIRKADIYPKATEHIDDMIEMVNRLVEDGFAYESNGDVYFRVSKFSEYGKLSKKNLDDLVAGARVEVSDKKENPLDFVLWKASKDGEPSWESPWGAGRPGWHIECSAMSKRYLGEEFDIHTGGVDLTFPHHENEIAQSEACCDHKVVNYWLHNGYINIDGEKMSKSLGNFFTTREILNKYPAEVVRFFLISNHYRSPINFSDQELDNSAKSLNKLENTVNKIDSLLALEVVAGDLSGAELLSVYQEKKEKLIEAMDDDFNTALAIGVLHELAKEVNRFVNNPTFELTAEVKVSLEKIKGLFDNFAKDVLGILVEKKEGNNDLVDPLISLLLDVREKSRQNKNYQLADEIRDRLDELGIEVKDTPQGAEWSLK